MCMPSAPKAQAPIIPPSAPRLSDPSVQGAGQNVRPSTGYAETVLTGALAPANTNKARALGKTAA